MQIPAIIRTIQTREKTELGDFYVVRQAVSNNGPGWSDTILDVRDEVGGVRVREIRIAPLNRNCAHRYRQGRGNRAPEYDRSESGWKI
jgi:hypothetical protein